uniref:Uncharacterized protein n=1 Tax=Rhizophora mucronata TaxID=61149 RepID=A0A2P2J487_RHIMU
MPESTSHVKYLQPSFRLPGVVAMKSFTEETIWRVDERIDRGENRALEEENMQTHTLYFSMSLGAKIEVSRLFMQWFVLFRSLCPA